MGPKQRTKKHSKRMTKELRLIKTKLATEKRWTSIGSNSCNSQSENQNVCDPGPSYSNVRKSDFESSQIEYSSANIVSPEYMFIDVNILKTFVSSFPCSKCLKKDLELVLDENFGFCSIMNVNCKNCSESVVSLPSSEKIVHSNIFYVNRRVAKAFAHIGKGYAALEQFSMVMNMKMLNKQSFHEQTKYLYKAAKASGTMCVSKARQRVRKHYMEQNPEISNDSFIDLAVSFDGTWHKRGHTSNYGVGCIIEIETGLVIDYHVLSKFCRKCAMTKADLGEDSPEFNFWFEGHKLDCERNYHGSSPAMEVTAAEILWKRSVAYKFRYTTLLGDGDSAVFTRLKELQIYGSSFELKKEECTNHIAKRLGTALRNVVKLAKAQKVTLGGKVYGALTNSSITKLTKYYHNAILKNANKDVQSMKNSIMATLHHCVSTDENPKHAKCPVGKDSWCFYNRALSENKVPGPHKQFIKTPINVLVLNHIAATYQRLTDNKLLERCLRGQSQNANESLHSCIWRRCDKSRSASKRIIDAAVADGVSEYNFGNITVLGGMMQSKLSPGRKSMLIARRRDARRKLRIKKSCTENIRQRKRRLQLENLRKEEQKIQEEGLTYGAGEF